MKILFRCSVLVLVTVGSALGQSEDWQALKGLPTGTKIKLTLKHQRTFGHCQLVDVTDTWLACYLGSVGVRKYAREEIREVRLGRNSGRTGLLIGLGAGVTAGLVDGRSGNAGRGVGVLVLTPVMGLIGAGIGSAVDPFLRGKPFYRSPEKVVETAKAQPPATDEASRNAEKVILENEHD